MVSAGPWGVWDAPVLFSPIIFLVVMVLKPRPMPAARSLWKAANIMFFIKVIYLRSSTAEAYSCFVSGVLQALVPVSIMSGAITLLDCMQTSQCLSWMKVQLRNITNCHPVAEVMLIGFCFSFICDGAGIRPVELAAPMLYSMGHPKLECVVSILLFNAFMSIFGAAGLPVWFGVGKAVPEYEESNLLDVGFKATLAMAVCAHVLVPYTVRIVVPMDELRPSWLFVHLSTCSVTLPFVVLSRFNYEFPSAAAGIIGVCITAGLTVFGIGLGAHKRNHGLGSFDEGEQAKDVENQYGSDSSNKEGREFTEALSPGVTKSVKIDEKDVRDGGEVQSPGMKAVMVGEQHRKGEAGEAVLSPGMKCGNESEEREVVMCADGIESVTVDIDTFEVKAIAFEAGADPEITDLGSIGLPKPYSSLDGTAEMPSSRASTKATEGRAASLRSASNLSSSTNDWQRKESERQDKEGKDSVARRAVDSVSVTFEGAGAGVVPETSGAGDDPGSVDLNTMIRPKSYTSLDEAIEMGRPGSTKVNVGRATFRSLSNLSHNARYQSSAARSSVHTRSSVHSSAYTSSRASSRGRLSRRGSTSSLRSRAVHADVQLTKKDIKVLTKRDNMNVPPADLISCLDDDDDAPAALRLQIGDEDAEEHNVIPTVSEVILRTMPLWLTFLLLILTRIEPLGLKELLREDTPRLVDGELGNLGHLSISTVGHISLTKIAGTTLSWTFELFYTPVILPFYVAGWATLLVFRKELTVSPVRLMGSVFYRLRGPAVALSGALVLVELMRTRDDDPAGKDAPAVIIGLRLADALADGWILLTFPLGALGAFFSGSTTVSMLTFSQVQKVAADLLGLRSEALIALQLCGATAGNTCCLANIISAKAVIGLHVSEGVIVKRLLLPVLAMYIMCTAVLLPFIYA